jgi:uncharacterized phage protein (TIGR01671 family)
MRGIKFRGLSKVTGKFVYGNLIQTSKYKDGHIHCWIQEKSLLGLGVLLTPTTRFVDVHSESVGQFTGLQDRSGVDVYEGDLLRIPAKSKYEETTYNCFEVFYHDNECIGGQNIGFCINRMHTQGNSGGGQGYKFTPESISKNGFVITGNIHENPELLNKVK